MLETNEISILVVDDNIKNLQVVGRVLKEAGYSIALAQGAKEALDSLENFTPDIFLLDVMMPDIDGYELCKRVKKMPDYSDVPVVFLTAKDTSEDVVEGFNAGGVDYIAKPFNAEELLTRVKTHLDLYFSKKTIKQQNEEILQMNRTRDKLFSVIAHDIKTPFTNIMMMTKFLAKGSLKPDSEDFREIVKGLNNTTRDTFNLLENLLQWTKSQTQNISVNKEDINVDKLILEAMDILQSSADNKKIKVERKIKKDLLLHADKNMMLVVVRNIISNAIKFTSGGGFVKINAFRSENKVQIEIRDSGVGISEENIEKIIGDTEYFTTYGTNNEKGSGLGVRLVKDFVNLNNGELHITSEVGKGTTFLIIITDR